MLGLWPLVFVRQRVDFFARAYNPSLRRLTEWRCIDARGVNGLRGIKGVEICKVTTRRGIVINIETIQDACNWIEAINEPEASVDPVGDSGLFVHKGRRL